MWRKLTDEQWAKIEPHLSEPRFTRRGGRPPADNRKCFEGIETHKYCNSYMKKDANGKPQKLEPAEYGYRECALEKKSSDSSI